MSNGLWSTSKARKFVSQNIQVEKGRPHPANPNPSTGGQPQNSVVTVQPQHSSSARTSYTSSTTQQQAPVVTVLKRQNTGDHVIPEQQARRDVPQQQPIRQVQVDPRYSIQDLHNTIFQLQNRIYSRDQGLQRLEEEFAAKSKHNDALARENTKLTEELSSLQVSSFGTMQDARWMPQEEGSVTRELDALRSAMNRFAKTYASDNIGNMEQLPEAVQLRLWTKLDRVVVFENNGPVSLQELSQIPHAARLCLTALISNSIHTRLFDRPFFFLDSGVTEKAVLAGTELDNIKRLLRPSEAFFDVLSKAARYDTQLANIWRSDTLRLLDPQHLPENSAASELVAETRKAILDSGTYYASAFDKDVYKPLLRGMEGATWTEFRRELQNIFVEAGQLSLRLWTQRPSLVVWCLDEIAGRPFTANSSLMQPHPLHKHDDPEDRSLDGLKTKVLVHPAVMVAGTHDAEQYERLRVRSKAVIWLDS